MHSLRGTGISYLLPTTLASCSTNRCAMLSFIDGCVTSSSTLRLQMVSFKLAMVSISCVHDTAFTLSAAYVDVFSLKLPPLALHPIGVLIAWGFRSLPTRSSKTCISKELSRPITNSFFRLPDRKTRTRFFFFFFLLRRSRRDGFCKLKSNNKGNHIS